MAIFGSSKSYLGIDLGGAGIKIVEADNPSQAKKKAKDIPIFMEKNGQLKLF